MDVVGYVRVSTTDQLDGYGLDVQEQSVTEWCDRNGHRLAAICRDEGVSGSNGIESRVGLLDALHLIEVGDASGLVVARLDRVARDLLIQETTLGQVWKMGASVFSVDTGEVPQDDPDDPMRTAFRQIVGVFAQLERGLIRARLRAGKQQKAAQGGYIGGEPPIGYAVEDGLLVENPDEQKAISRIRELHDEGSSLRVIARALDSEGLLPRRSAHWHPDAVRRVLARGREVVTDDC